MPTIDLTPEQLHAHITGLPLRTGIYSDFNACMHRAGCQQTQAAHVVLLAEVEALRKDAERYRKLCDVPGALDAFTAAYHNTQTKVQLDAAVDRVPAAVELTEPTK